MKQTQARELLEQGCDYEEQQKYDLAFACYLQAARMGNKESQVNLGNLYDSGQGCSPDPKKAVYWYKRAVKNGEAHGAYNLGVHYKTLGNARWASYWFLKAVSLGHDYAADEL